MVTATFSDIPTDFNCSSLVSELTKFILYYKQQIPFTYDKLRIALDKHKLEENRDSSMCTLSQNLYQVAEKSINILREIFDKTSQHFSNNDGIVTEIAFLFGSSLLTPKQVYRLKLPLPEKGHIPKYHSSSSIFSDVFKSIIKSEKLNHMLSKPLGPTNMFLLFKMQSVLESEPWLIPKPRFNIPPFVQQINLNFLFETPERCHCMCKGFQVYSDNSMDESLFVSAIDTIQTHERVAPAICDDMWYQVPLVFKGFKDVYVKGISVSRDWLTSTNCP